MKKTHHCLHWKSGGSAGKDNRMLLVVFISWYQVKDTICITKKAELVRVDLLHFPENSNYLKKKSFFFLIGYFLAVWKLFGNLTLKMLVSVFSSAYNLSALRGLSSSNIKQIHKSHILQDFFSFWRPFLCSYWCSSLNNAAADHSSPPIIYHFKSNKLFLTAVTGTKRCKGVKMYVQSGIYSWSFLFIHTGRSPKTSLCFFQTKLSLTSDSKWAVPPADFQ